MSELVDRLVELTGQRDRDVLDATLARAFRDLLDAGAVSVYRPIGSPGNERWMTRARLVGRAAVAEADAAWVELDQLPRLEAFASRHEALREERVVYAVTAQQHLTLFPVCTDREAVGVLEIESAQALTAAQQRMVASVLRLYQNCLSLLDYSERDSLTGLLNRKTFDESFLKASGESSAAAAADDSDGRRAGGVISACWLGVIDIDRFKNINDRYGHLIGDEVLLLLARLLRSSLRVHDRVYRFGGEEFVVMMRCPSDEYAAVGFERLRQNVGAYPFPQVGNITVSVGFTRVKPGDTPGAAFERADRAVYHAKAHGRDQVRSFAALVASGDLIDDSKVGGVELF